MTLPGIAILSIIINFVTQIYIYTNIMTLAVVISFYRAGMTVWSKIQINITALSVNCEYTQ